MSENLLLIPTCKRPERLARCLDSVVKNSTCSRIMVIFYTEDDSDYSKIFEMFSDKVEFTTTDLNSCPSKLNQACDRFGRQHDHVSFIGDDCVITTPKWDEICVRHIQDNFDGLGVVSPCEPSWGRNYDDLPLHWMQSTSFWTTVGYYVHRGMKHCYVDNLIREFAKSIDAYAKIPNCIIEHHHPNHGFQNDEVYDIGEKKHCENDKIIYHEYLGSSEYREIINRLREKKSVQRPL